MKKFLWCMTLVAWSASGWDARTVLAQDDPPADAESTQDPAAQEDPAADPATDEPATDEPAAEAPTGVLGEFATKFDEFKAVLTRMRQLQEEYRVASAADREPLVKEWDTLREKADVLVPVLKGAALEAYKAAPNQNKDITDFLTSVVLNGAKASQFAEAANVASVLVDNEFPDRKMVNLAGMYAFYANDPVNARKYLELAKEVRAIDKDGEACLAELTIRDAEAAADDLPRVKLTTSKGDIVIELFENEAPNTVANFVSLVEKKFYDGLTFHRVLQGFMAQGGDPDGTGSGGPGYSIDCECGAVNHRNHFVGSLSMAHAGENTGGSQFFLTFGRTAHLDGVHTVFGRVIEGLDVLNSLQLRDPNDPQAPEPDKIVTATVIRKRDHEYTPKTNPDPAP